MRLVVLSLWLAAALHAQEPLHEVCSACHATAANDLRSHKHLAAGLDCDTCHGPSEAHRAAAGQAPPDRVAAPHQMAALCGTCHSQQADSYGVSAHGKLVAALSKTRAPHCGTCHDTHRTRPFAALERRCQACHQQRPEACSALPSAQANVSCAACHKPHEFLAR